MSAKASKAPSGRDGRPIPPEIISAARRSFLHFGVQRATVADVASAAGMPRQSVYEYVSSRNDLISAALIQRIKEIGESVQEIASRTTDFGSAFVELSVAAVQVARSDTELMNFFATGPRALIQEIVAGPSEEIHGLVRELLGPILDRGLASGELRGDQSRDQIIDWIRLVYLALISKDSLDEDELRATIGGFLLPSLVNSSAVTAQFVLNQSR